MGPLLTALALLVTTASECPQAPEYTRLAALDQSQASVLEVRVDVRLTAPPTPGVVEAVACTEIVKLFERRVLQVVTFHVWGPEDATDGPPSARAVWAAHGDPSRAANYAPGDLRRHILRIEVEGQAPRQVRALPVAPWWADEPRPSRPEPAPRTTSSASKPDGVAAPPISRTDLLVLVERWRKAWETRDLERYLGFYSSRFRSSDMDLRGWRARKTKVFRGSGQIRVEVREPQVLSLGGGKASVRFVQVYESDRHRDVGVKTLDFESENGIYRIVSEVWVPQ